MYAYLKMKKIKYKTKGAFCFSFLPETYCSVQQIPIGISSTLNQLYGYACTEISGIVCPSEGGVASARQQIFCFPGPFAASQKGHFIVKNPSWSNMRLL